MELVYKLIHSDQITVGLCITNLRNSKCGQVFRQAGAGECISFTDQETPLQLSKACELW